MYKSIETLRIFAAILVVLAHMPNSLETDLLKIFNGSIVFCGSIGVDLFFIISGFVIAGTIERLKETTNHGKMMTYLKDRTARVFPLYCLTTIIAGLFYFFKHKDIDLSHLINSLFFIVSYAAACIFFKSDKNWLTVILLLSYLAHTSFNFYYGEPIIFEFLFGFLIYKNKEYIHTKICSLTSVTRNICGLFAVLIFFAAATGVDSYSGSEKITEMAAPRMYILLYGEEMPRWIAWGIPSSLFFILFITLEKKISWPFSFLGKYTYSVYLWQFFIFYVLNTTIALGFPELFSILIFIILLSITSYLSFNFFERPTNLYIKQYSLKKEAN